MMRPPLSVGFPFSLTAIRRRVSPYGPMYDFLRGLSVHDRLRIRDDFDYKALDTTNKWTVDAGAGATTWAITAGLNGFLRGITGTTAATSGLQLITPLALFSGDKNMSCEFRWRISAITELRVEIGFLDAFGGTDVNIPTINSLTSPTFTNNCNFAALYVYDHTGSTTTTGLYMKGTGVTANKSATTLQRPVANTWQVVRIEAVNDYVYVFIDGYKVASTNTQTIEGGDAMKFGIYVKSSNGTSKNVDVDWTDLQVDRT